MMDYSIVKKIYTVMVCMAVISGSGCSSMSTDKYRFAGYRPDVMDRNLNLWSNKDNSENIISSVQISSQDNAVIGKTNVSVKVLKQGDKILISLRGIPEKEDIKDVIDDLGNIKLPLIGRIKVEGYATSKAESIIEKTYVKRGYYNKIDVNLVAQEDQYFVRGEVKKEGKYSLSGDLTLLQAITTAGGYTEYAKHTKIKIIRGEKVLEFDLRRIEQRKDKDPLIMPGDIIIVPRRWV